MIANILISPSLDKRIEQLKKLLDENKITENHPDLLYFKDEEKLGVEQAKKIREHLSLKPYQAKGRVVVIESAQNLTHDAQNALLKTLEEPPEEAIIILGTDNEDSLLPTVLSRCKVQHLNYQLPITNYQFEEDIEKLKIQTIPERFIYIEKLEEKEEFLEAMLAYYQKKLPENLEFTKLLLQAEEWKEANGNIRAILEYLMLEMPKI